MTESWSLPFLDAFGATGKVEAYEVLLRNYSQFVTKYVCDVKPCKLPLTFFFNIHEMVLYLFFLELPSNVQCNTL